MALKVLKTLVCILIQHFLRSNLVLENNLEIIIVPSSARIFAIE